MPAALSRPPDATPDISIEDLTVALRSAWSAETSVSPSSWGEANPAAGQCAVTALVVQDFFGGDLMRAVVRPDVSHYWNRLPDGRELDLTKSQFPSFELAVPPVTRSREFVLSFPETVRRYDIFLERTLRALERRRE